MKKYHLQFLLGLLGVLLWYFFSAHLNRFLIQGADGTVDTSFHNIFRRPEFVYATYYVVVSLIPDFIVAALVSVVVAIACCLVGVSYPWWMGLAYFLWMGFVGIPVGTSLHAFSAHLPVWARVIEATTLVFCSGLATSMSYGIYVLVSRVKDRVVAASKSGRG